MKGRVEDRSRRLAYGRIGGIDDQKRQTGDGERIILKGLANCQKNEK